MVRTQTLGRFGAVYRSWKQRLVSSDIMSLFLVARQLKTETVPGIVAARKMLVIRYVLLAYLLLILAIVRGVLYSQHYEAHYKSDYVWILSAHLVAFIPMNILMGVFADKLFGRSEMFLTGSLICLVAYSLNLASPTLAWVCLSESIYGIGEACFTATAGAWYRYMFATSVRKQYMVQKGLDKLTTELKKRIHKIQMRIRDSRSRKVFGWKYPLVMFSLPVILLVALKYVSVMVVGWITICLCAGTALWFFWIDPLPTYGDRKELNDPTPKKEKLKDGLVKTFVELFSNQKIIRLSMTGIISSASWTAIAALMYFEVFRSELSHFANLLGVGCLVFIGAGHIVQAHKTEQNPQKDEIEWMHRLLIVSGVLVLIIGVLARFEKLIFVELAVLAALSFCVGRFSNLFMGSIYDYVRPGNEGIRTSLMSVYLSIEKLFVLMCNWLAYAMTARYSLGGSAMMLTLSAVMMTAGGWGVVLNYANQKISENKLRIRLSRAARKNNKDKFQGTS